MKKTKLRNLSEEMQDYIASHFLDEATNQPVYTVGTQEANFTIEDFVDIQDLDRIALNHRVLLTMYYDGGTLHRTGKQSAHFCNYRFLAKGSHANNAMDRARALLEWLEDERTFVTATYRIWVLTQPRLPGVIGRGEHGSYLADFVVSISAHTRV